MGAHAEPAALVGFIGHQWCPSWTLEPLRIAKGLHVVRQSELATTIQKIKKKSCATLRRWRRDGSWSHEPLHDLVLEFFFACGITHSTWSLAHMACCSSVVFIRYLPYVIRYHSVSHVIVPLPTPLQTQEVHAGLLANSEWLRKSSKKLKKENGLSRLE